MNFLKSPFHIIAPKADGSKKPGAAYREMALMIRILSKHDYLFLPEGVEIHKDCRIWGLSVSPKGIIYAFDGNGDPLVADSWESLDPSQESIFQPILELLHPVVSKLALDKLNKTRA